MKFSLLLLLCFIMNACDSNGYDAIPVSGSETVRSMHQDAWEQHKDYLHTYISRSRLASSSFNRLDSSKHLSKDVFGFYPHWMGSAYSYIQWELLSTVAYFGIEVDQYGDIASYAGWPDSTTANNVIVNAHQHNVRVELTVIAFSSTIHEGILKNSSNRSQCIQNIVGSVKDGNADGINLDFEGMTSDCGPYFTTFVQELRAALDAGVPGGSISIDLPAVDWSDVFDLAELSRYVDTFFIMGYDFHWKSSDPGPVSPLAGASYNLTRSTQTYLAGVVSPAKVVVGIPFYGYDWPSSSQYKGASKLANATATLYSSTLGHSYTWDEAASTPWYSYQADGEWHQVWFENKKSIDAKLDMIAAENAAGMGIWALGYDGSSSDLWDIIEAYALSETSNPEGSHENPYSVTLFPYQNTSSTAGKESLFDSYPPFLADESGPEEVYKIFVPAKGTLAVSIEDGEDYTVDIDVHLLTDLDCSTCLIRDDKSFEFELEPGEYFLVCDTYAASSKAGAYTLTIDFNAAECIVPASIVNEVALTAEDDYMEPQFSPDRRYILCTTANYRGLYIISLSNKALYVVTEDASIGYGARWSPDSQYIIAYPGGDMKIFDLAGTVVSADEIGYVDTAAVYVKDNIIYLKAESSSQDIAVSGTDDSYFLPLLSPDAGKVSYLGLSSGIAIAHLEDGTITRIGQGSHVNWMPDSSGIIYGETEEDGIRITRSDICFARCDGSEMINLTNTPDRHEYHPHISADGTMIAYVVDGQIYMGELE